MRRAAGLRAAGFLVVAGCFDPRRDDVRDRDALEGRVREEEATVASTLTAAPPATGDVRRRAAVLPCGTVALEEGVGRPIQPAFRALLGLFVALAIGATVSLVAQPERTEDLFAWPIAPPFTAALLGAGYASALVLFTLTLREREWANARVAVSAPLTLSSAMLVATLLHLDRFPLDEGGLPAAIAWIWLVVYIIVPPALVAVAIMHATLAGEDPPRTRPVPPPLRLVSAVSGLLAIVGGAALFAVPSEVADHWPWKITPLTGRALAAWILGLGVAAVHVTLDNDLRRMRAASPALATVGVVGLIAVARFAEDLDGGWGTIALVVVLLGFVGLGGAAWRLEHRTDQDAAKIPGSRHRDS